MPTLHTSEIYRNTLARLGVALDAHKQGKLKNVRLFNYMTQSFGRTYYRIELEVELTEPVWFNFPDIFSQSAQSPKPLTPEQQDTNKLYERLQYPPAYFSFNKQYDTEEEVQVHYEWITALVEFHLRHAGAPMKIEYFETERSREYERQRELERPRREQEQQEFLSTYAFLGDAGDLAVVEDWQNSRLIQLDHEHASSHSPYGGLELKADFTTGKRRVNYISESKVLAIFTREQLATIQQAHPFTRNKAGLLQLLTESRTGLLLKYSKPMPPKIAIKHRKAHRTR
jgi:hypothetical protein